VPILGSVAILEAIGAVRQQDHPRVPRAPHHPAPGYRDGLGDSHHYKVELIICQLLNMSLEALLRDLASWRLSATDRATTGRGRRARRSRRMPERRGRSTGGPNG
jgi:hypothetical protein